MATTTMMVVEEKQTEYLELYTPLRDYMVVEKSLPMSAEMEGYLMSLETMRNDVEKGRQMTLEARRDLMHNYFKHLCIIESSLLVSFCFSWSDAFKKDQKASENNIHFEKAAIIFNLGAIHSQIASSAKGPNQACNAFQSAAAAFAFLRDNISVKASAGNSTVDVSVECADMLERVMLGQAQECFYNQLIANANYPNSHRSHVARQVSIYYQEAYVALTLPPLNRHFNITWIAHVHLKSAVFYGEACYRLSLHLHEKQEIGEEIARLKDGLTTLTNAKRCANEVESRLVPLVEMASKLEEDINLNLKRATEENETIYQQIVPAIDTLPPLHATSFVKSTPIDESLDVTKDEFLAQCWLAPDFNQLDQTATENCSIQ